MTRGRLLGVAATALAVAALGARAEANVRSMSGQFFVSGRTVYCGTELLPHEGSDHFLTCWRPRSGFVVTMTHRGPADARPSSAYRRFRPATDGLLPAGQTWWVSRELRVGRGRPPSRPLFRCTARLGGLRCLNSAGRGWWLGRDRGFRIT